ncbi:MAG: glucosamine-6-phosphate deaminase [Melioribacteraceae bacterium]|nr:glucosamine-6-phosphate deaminase [Melioribacteraceae bacterium]
MKIMNLDLLNIVICENRIELGKSAAANIGKLISNLLEIKDEIRMVFAAAPSQNEFLAELVKTPDIDWSKIIAFHMDEYIGLPKNAEQLFGRYLNDHLFSKVNLKDIIVINSQAERIEAECERYEILLRENIIDIVCLGIGENGHIAFNDPPVADFNDKKFVKIVELDMPCRQQQVNDGCFSSLEQVPKFAVTLTVPALMSGSHLSIAVPGTRKADAVKRCLYNKISTECPASILRTHQNAILYLDKDSASML